MSGIKVLSVNVGRRGSVQIGSKEVETGIHKLPERGGVRVTEQGLVDDVIVDVKHHGGPDQAVYLYSEEDYAWWAAELQWELEPGTFGENLTLSSFGPAPLRIGDRFQIGEVLLEVTFPRIPCATLAARVGDSGFVKRFARARRPGAYTRVLQTGRVAANDAVTLLPTPDGHPSLVEMFDLWYAKEYDPALLRRALAAPLSERARATCEQLLLAATG